MQTRLVIHDQLSPRYAELNPHVILVPTPVMPMRDLDHDSAADDSGVVGIELRGPFPDVRFDRTCSRERLAQIGPEQDPSLAWT